MTTSEQPARRAVTLTRTDLGRYVVRNARGVELEFGHADDLLTPVELLLAAVGGCSAIDVDYITAKRSAPKSFEVTVDAAPADDPDGGHRLGDVAVDFRVTFPDTDEGRAAAAVVQRSVQQSRDRLCTVSRTVAHETPVAFSVGGEPV